MVGKELEIKGILCALSEINYGITSPCVPIGPLEDGGLRNSLQCFSYAKKSVITWTLSSTVIFSLLDVPYLLLFSLRSRLSNILLYFMIMEIGCQPLFQEGKIPWKLGREI